jgi:transposase
MAASVIPIRYRLRLKQRLAVVTYAEEHGIKPAGRHFGIDHKTVREWRKRWRHAGERGLLPRYPDRRRRRLDERVIALITHARSELEFGAVRTQIWLARVHQVRTTARTIQRVFRDIGLPYLTKTPRRPRQLKLFEKEKPGDSVQIDVKVVTRQHSKWFQYTAIDDCTRIRVLRLYRHLNQRSSLGVPARSPSGDAVPDSQDSGRQRHGVLVGLRLDMPGARRSCALHQAATTSAR